jgi:hypothetical protein
VTVVIGVVTVNVVPVGVLTFTVVIGVLTATVAETGEVSVTGRETVGARSTECSSDDVVAWAVDATTAAGSAVLDSCVDGPAVRAFEL